MNVKYYFDYRFIKQSLLAVSLFLPSQIILAQPIATEVLDEVEIQRSNFNAVVKVLFKQPLRYLSHSPAHKGKTLIIRVNLVSSGTRSGDYAFESESIKVNSDIGLNEVVFEPSHTANSTILFYFDDSTAYDVIPSSEQRSLSIVIYGLAE